MAVCAGSGCGGGGASEADACVDDYVLFTMGVPDDDVGFVELENGDSLRVQVSPIGLVGVVVSIHARGIDAAQAELTTELVANGETIAIAASGVMIEGPLGYEWPERWIVFEQFPDGYIGQTVDLRGRITDSCERTGSAERAVMLVDGR